jgi:two-component system, NtrC family, nitrogen regulation response regulator GlnG
MIRDKKERPESVRRGIFTTMQNNSHIRRVLVVDDELLIRWALREALEAEGYAVTEAADAAAARRALDERGAPLDAVVLDYRLPDSNDLGLLASMRQAAPAMPVIMMTAYSTADMVKDALDLGAFRVVGKPFEVHQMVDLVGDALAAR